MSFSLVETSYGARPTIRPKLGRITSGNSDFSTASRNITRASSIQLHSRNQSISLWSKSASSILGNKLSLKQRKVSTWMLNRKNGFICRGNNSDSSFLPNLKAGKKIESDSISSSVREACIEAIEDLGGRVTVGDVAARTGLKLSEAEKVLRALAADTRGFLEVSEAGDVLYVIPRDARSILIQKSFRQKLEPTLKTLKGAGEYLIRVAFGTALLASIAITYSAIAIILSSSRSEENNRDDGYRNQRRSFGPSFYINPFDFLWYWNPNYYARVRERRESRGMSFFDAVFSFVFGDGDPTEDIEEERWKLVGDYISRKGGVVTAEELAPYLNPPALDVSRASSLYPRDESFVIPLLQRFDGVPEVDEEGNILYCFPSLQRTATDWLGRKKVRGDFSLQSEAGRYFVEAKRKFSEASQNQIYLAIGLGVLNFVGVVVLSSLVRDPVVVRQVGSGLVTFASEALPALLTYATSFFFIPALRFFRLSGVNAAILERNSAREQWARYVASRQPELLQKQANARRLAERTVITKDDVIYTTEKDLIEQDIEGLEFERKLEERF